MKTPTNLYGPEPMGEQARWKVDLCWHTLGRPLEERYPELVWTSGRRASEHQDAIAADPATAWKVARDPVTGARKLSQHEFAEALDCDGPRRLLMEAYRWAHAHLPWWQLIIYFKEPEPPDGIGESMHLSILSEVREIERKALYYVNGAPQLYQGRFEGVA